MKILEDLFKVVSLQTEGVADGSMLCKAELLPKMDSVVFKAHFPDKPVVPGACLVGAVGEMVGRATGQQYLVNEIKNVKFVSLIEPEEGELVNIELNIVEAEKNLSVSGTVCYKGKTCVKLRLA